MLIIDSNITYVDKDLLIRDLSMEFKKDNHLFDVAKFMNADIEMA